MIKVIAFDFGDVLVKDTLKTIERKYWTGKVSPAAKRTFLKTLHKIDTGKAGEKYLIQALHETLTPHLSIKQIQKHLHASRLLPPWQLLKKVERKYPIAILTNNYKTGPAAFAKLLKIDLSPYKVINSSHLGVRKPHADYYRLALRRLRVKPDEIVFIDDLSANVAGAKRVGIPSFRYNKNIPQLRAFLKRHGIIGL